MSGRLKLAGCCETPEAPPPLAEGEREQMVAAFRALGDVTRLEIFRLLAAQREPVCVCDVVDRFDVSQPTISHHLRILREAGLVTVSRRGVWAWYAPDPQGMAWLQGMVSELAGSEMAATLDSGDRLAATG